MMRSLFSGVAGLKTHQTRMDVIGNNIANVNTTAYKSQSMVFNDLLYQTSQAASGANATTGRGGTNARQIGLGAKTGGISTTITTQGSAQSTNNPWDIMIEGDAFFIVSDGSQNFFTRDGSFTIDGAGNLVMTSTGYTVMGWQVDPETGEVRSDVVSALQVMHPDNLTAPPEATSLGYMRGILDSTDTDLNSTRGVVRTLKFYDALGFEYTALFSVHATGNADQFRVQLDDIKDSTGMSLVTKYGLSSIEEIAEFGTTEPTETINKFGMTEGVTFDIGDSTANPAVPPHFTLSKAMEQMLTGFSSNNLVVAAGESVKVTKISKTSDTGATTDTTISDTDTGEFDVNAGDKVTVSGNVELKRGMLEASPYNLIYVDPNPAEGITGGWYTKDANGGIGQAIKDGVSDAEADKPNWGSILGEKFKNVKISSAVVNGENVTISFEAEFTAELTAKYNAGKKTFGVTLNVPDDNAEILNQVYKLVDGDGKTYAIDYIAPDGSAQIITSELFTGNMLAFDHDSGKFSYIGNQGSKTALLDFKTSASSLAGQLIDLTQFGDIEIDFSSVSHLGNGGKSTLEMTNGSKEDSALGAGRKTGDLIGIEVAQDGKIKATYDNGMTKLLGQIAVAEFANPSGLAKAGNNLYDTTLNSGEFDGVGVDVTASGGTMTSGVLEMSNVDLSAEFTTMITTQRGFQANSRIITVSDSLLEELTSLKR